MPVDKPSGRYLLLAVEVSQPTALGALFAIVNPRQDVLPISAEVPEGVGDTEYADEQENNFPESRMVAAAAAARAAGFEIS